MRWLFTSVCDSLVSHTRGFCELLFASNFPYEVIFHMSKPKSAILWKNSFHAIRFCIENNEAWNLCMAVLRMEQLVFERLQGGFASCTKGVWTFAWRFCVMYKRALNVCMTVLHREQKGLERLHDGFARVQKGLEVSSWGFCTCTKGYWSWFMGEAVRKL